MKLVKSKNRKLFGVCGGLAQFLGVNPFFVRLLFVLGAIFSGSILLWIYLILAITLEDEI